LRDFGDDAVVRRSRLWCRAASVVSSRLTHAVAGSLALGALSMCLIVTLTVLSIKAGIAMPAPV